MPGHGTRGRGDLGTWDSRMPGRGTQGREGVPINKQHLNFALNFQFTIFGWQEKVIR